MWQDGKKDWVRDSIVRCLGGIQHSGVRSWKANEQKPLSRASCILRASQITSGDAASGVLGIGCSHGPW